MEKVLVSACLLGRIVRYNGKALSYSDQILQRWIDEGRVVSVCPEVDAGMSVPRAPAEIQRPAEMQTSAGIISSDKCSGPQGGAAVLAGEAEVIDNLGNKVTDYFLWGADTALSLCKQHRIKIAVLTESSPSCGSTSIHDGTFSGTKIAGEGVTAALLRGEGVEVFNQHSVHQAQNRLSSIPL